MIAAALCLAAMPADAAGRRTAPQARKAEKAVPAKVGGERGAEAKRTGATPERTEPAGVWTSGEQDRACFRSRRKLWQDGQGWVVKRVSVCP